MSDELDIDDDGLDGFDDFGMGDMDDPAEPGRNRTPAQRARDGALKKVTDGQNRARLGRMVANNALPDDVKAGVSGIEDAIGEATDIYDDTKDKLEKPYKRLKKSVHKSTDRLKFLPESVRERIKKATFVEDEAGRSREAGIEESISATMSEVFKNQMQTQGQQQEVQKEQHEASESNKQARFKASSSFFERIATSNEELNRYKQKVEFPYHQKTLELQQRQLLAQQELLKSSQAFFSDSISNLREVVKNTGLPEFTKIQNNERIFTSFYQDLYGKVAESSTDKLQNFGQGLAENARRKAAEFADSLASGMDMGADMLEMSADMGGDLDPAESGAGMPANFGLNRLATRAGKKLGKMGQNDPGIKAMMDKFAYGTENWQRILTEKVEGGPMAGLLGDLLPGVTTGKNTVVNSLKKNAAQPSFFNQMTQRSITEIIPGYLARLLKVNTDMRDGGDSGSLVRFSMEKEGFVKQDEEVKRLNKKVFNTSRTEGAITTALEIVDALDPENQLTSVARQEFIEQLIREANDKSAAFSIERYRKKGPKEVRQLLTDRFGGGNNKSKIDGDIFTAEQNKMLSRKYNELGEGYGDIQDTINTLAAGGQKDLAREMGLLTNDGTGDKVDHDFIRRNFFKQNLHTRSVGGSSTPYQSTPFVGPMQDPSIGPRAWAEVKKHGAQANQSAIKKYDELRGKGTHYYDEARQEAKALWTDEGHRNKRKQQAKQKFDEWTNKVQKEIEMYKENPELLKTRLEELVKEGGARSKKRILEEIETNPNLPEEYRKRLMDSLAKSDDWKAQIVKSYGSVKNALDGKTKGLQGKAQQAAQKFTAWRAQAKTVFRQYREDPRALMTELEQIIDEAGNKARQAKKSIIDEIEARKDLPEKAKKEMVKRVRAMEGSRAKFRETAKRTAGDMYETLSEENKGRVDNARGRVSDAAEKGKERMNQAKEDGMDKLREGQERLQAAQLDATLANAYNTMDAGEADKRGVFSGALGYLDRLGHNGLGLLNGAMNTLDKETRDALKEQLRKHGNNVSGKVKGALRAIGLVDLYLPEDDPAKDDPIISAQAMERGEYFNPKTGRPIRSIHDIRTKVVDTEGRTIVTKRTLMKGLVDINGKRVKLGKGMIGKFTDGFVKSLQISWGAQLAVPVIAFKAAKRGLKKVKNIFLPPPDLYVYGEETPRLIGRDIQKGRYATSKPGSDKREVFYKVKKIKGPVWDRETGRNVLTVEEIQQGLIDHNGKRIDIPLTFLGKAWKMAKGAVGTPFKVLGKGMQLGGKGLKHLYDVNMGSLKMAKKFAGMPFKAMDAYGEHRENAKWANPEELANFKKREGGIPLDGETPEVPSGSGESEATVEAVNDGTKATNKVVAYLMSRFGKTDVDLDGVDSSGLGKIGRKIKNVFKGEETVSGDTDGDGDREGSWKDQRQEQEDVEKEAEKGKDPSKKAKGKSPWAWIGGLLLGGVGKIVSSITGVGTIISNLFSWFTKGGLLSSLSRLIPGKGLVKGAVNVAKNVGKTALRWGGRALMGGLALKAGAVAAAGYAGWKVGGWLNKGLDWSLSKLTGEETSLGGQIFKGMSNATKAFNDFRKWITGNEDLQPLEEIRFYQYGIHGLDKNQKAATRALEKLVDGKVKVGGGGVSIGEDTAYFLEETHELFGVDISDERQSQLWGVWFSKRFMPIYMDHLGAANKLFGVEEVREIDDNIDEDSYGTFLKMAVKFGNRDGQVDPFKVNVEAFPGWETPDTTNYVKAKMSRWTKVSMDPKEEKEAKKAQAQEGKSVTPGTTKGAGGNERTKPAVAKNLKGGPASKTKMEQAKKNGGLLDNGMFLTPNGNQVKPEVVSAQALKHLEEIQTKALREHVMANKHLEAIQKGIDHLKLINAAAGGVDEDDIDDAREDLGNMKSGMFDTSSSSSKAPKASEKQLVSNQNKNM